MGANEGAAVQAVSREPEPAREPGLSPVWAVAASRRTATGARGADDCEERGRDQILDSVLEGILRLDRDGIVVYANCAAARLLGCAVPEVVGTSAHHLMRCSPPAASGACGIGCPFHRTLSRGQSRRVRDEVVSRRDGSSLTVDLTLAPIVERGAVTGAVVTLADAAERHALDRREEEFIAVVSHELRTPLTSIRGGLGLLAGGVVGELPDEAAQIVQMALASTDRLTHLVNDILDLERLASGEMIGEVGRLDAADVMRQTAEQSRGLARDASVALHVTTTSVPVRADAHRLAQALTNLIGNAIKFSPPGSGVGLLVERHGPSARLVVRDHGRGIPADRLDHIFDRFGQVEGEDASSKGGFGLGLPIARRIVEEHGGRLLVSSVLGEGSTFTIELPVDGPVTDPDRYAEGLVRR